MGIKDKLIFPEGIGLDTRLDKENYQVVVNSGTNLCLGMRLRSALFHYFSIILGRLQRFIIFFCEKQRDLELFRSIHRSVIKNLLKPCIGKLHTPLHASRSKRQ